MAGRLVTIATFDEAPKAHLAKSLLERAGIRAALTDEDTVSNIWHLSTAIGGIKVKVLEEDAERAVAVLEEELGPEEDEEIDPEQLAAEAEAAAPEEGVAPPTPSPAPSPSDGMPSPAADEFSLHPSRDDYARRVFFAAWLGLAFPPLALVALYFLLNALFGSGSLSPRGRFNAIVGGLLTTCGMSFGMLFCCGFGRFFR